MQFFDLAAGDVTLGTTRPLISVQVPTAAATVTGTMGLDFSAGWLINNRLSIFGTTTAEGSTVASGLLVQTWVA